MRQLLALFAAGAVLQLAMPVQAASGVMAALCSGGAPVPLPMKDQGQPCCKVCHSAMRKRTDADSCCEEEED